MNTPKKLFLLTTTLIVPMLATRAAEAPVAPAAPSEWVDPKTGHLVVRLSTEAPTASMYFHQNGYTPDGKKLLMFTPQGMATVDLQTHKIDVLVPGFHALSMSMSNGIEVSRKEPVVYYNQTINGQNAVIAMNLNTHEWKQAAVLPQGAVLGGITADDAMIVGIRNVAGGKQIYTVDLKTGETKSFFPSEDNLSHDNLNHFECSPTDPKLILFAHEGTWSQVERIWTMHTDGTGLKLMHARTMPNEIAGHEFFSHDGKWVYYDLQTPQSDVFWIGGANTQTGEHIRYPVQRSEWSVHYNVSWDGKLFSGDGGGPSSVANRQPGGGSFDPPQNGQWIYLFRPQLERTTTIKVNGEDVKVIPVQSEKLVDMSKHVYISGREVEPNATFTPDDKWLTFRSDMEGVLHTYAVEIAKATPDEIKKIDGEWAAYKTAGGTTPQPK